MGDFVNQGAIRRQAFGRRTAPPSSAGFFAPTPSAPPAAGLPSAFDARAVIARSFALMGHNGVTFLALVAAAAVPNRVAYHVLNPQRPAFLLVYFVTTLLVCAPLYGAVFSGALKTLRGEAVSFQSCFRAGLRQPLAAMLLSLMTSLFVWLLLIVPAFRQATRWAVAAPVAIAEGGDVPAALARSNALTAPHRVPVAALVLLLAGMAVVRAVPILAIWGLPLDGVIPFMFGNWLFPLLLTAFTAAAGASLYYELCQGKISVPQGAPLVIEKPPLAASLVEQPSVQTVGGKPEEKIEYLE
jgi:hypothetical protein